MSRLMNKISALYIICWTFLPFMQIGSIYRYMAIFFALLWGITAVSIDVGFVKKYQIFFLCVIISTMGMIIWRILLGLSMTSAFLQTLQFLIIMLDGMIALFYHENDIRFFKKIFTILLILIMIFAITTMQGIIENPYAARIANSEWLAERYAGNEMVGLYGYIYMCVFIVPMLLYIILKRIRFNKITNIMIKVDVVVLLTTILLAGYMIAIFCTIGSCFLIWALNKPSVHKTIFLLFCFLIFLLYYEDIVNGIFSFLAERLSDNPVYYGKLVDFQALFSSGDFTGYTVEGRFSNYAGSFSSIVKYPFWGSYFFGEQGGGGHSAILDVFGKFGLGIGMIYSYLFFWFPHKIGHRDLKWDGLDYILFFLTLIFGFLDPFFQEIGIAIYIIFPFVKRMETMNERL